MICLQCDRLFPQITTRQLFCDTSCRNKYNAKKRTHKVQMYERGVSELYIYEIICNVNGWVYIGLTCDVDRRWGKHLSNLQTNRHKNVRLQDDFNKYGISAFEISVLLKQDVEGEGTWYEMRALEEQLMRHAHSSYNDSSNVPQSLDDPTRKDIEKLKASLGREPGKQRGRPRTNGPSRTYEEIRKEKEDYREDKMDLPTLKCRQCETLFTSIRSNNLFCCEKCRNTFHNQAKCEILKTDKKDFFT